MNDSGEADAQGASDARRWLLFIHQLAPKPDYLRVKTRRRLRKLGAVPIKQTVYALPSSEEALEDLQWLRREIEAEGGSAVIAEAEFVGGITDEDLDAMLETERRLPGIEDTHAAALHHVEPGQTWVTRQNVHVDRIASAWLIRRFIDAEARFKFVAARGYKPKRGELRFDMFEAEYTHVGEDCTFQTLVRQFGLRDAALRAIGQAVHDIDFKDERFNRPETAGIAGLIGGIVQAHKTDHARVERGTAVLDDLYAFFRSRRA
ncbi:MAG: chromate resistance protein ChrB domain-containing protein [Gemmatimonadaceae bacterium]